MLRARLAHRSGAKSANKAIEKSAATGGLALTGQLDGDWGAVDGYIAITEDFTAGYPDIGHLQVLLRGFEAEREGDTNRYHVRDWDRRAYWLDADGDGPGIPHLLSALQFMSNYRPQPDDEFPEFRDEPAVVAACTESTPCSINFSPYALYRESGVDYASFPEGAAEADLLFVAAEDGVAIATLVDLHDESGEYSHSVVPLGGDEIIIALVGYRLAEPGFVYLVEHTDFVTVEPAFAIDARNYIPGDDFDDPLVPPAFDAGGRTVKFLLDAQRESSGEFEFAFGGPFDLGFAWANAQTFVFGGSFEGLAADEQGKFSD